MRDVCISKYAKYACKVDTIDLCIFKGIVYIHLYAT